MTNVLHWRKPTWALALWSGYITTWALLHGPRPDDDRRCGGSRA